MVDRCTLPGQGRAPEVALFNCITRTSSGFCDFSQLSLSLLTWSGDVAKTETSTILESKADSGKWNIQGLSWHLF